MKKIRTDVVALVQMGMLAAIAVVLVMLIHFPIIPAVSFIEYDMADVPVLIGTLLYGPIPGLLILLVASLVQAFILGINGWVGFVMHFVASGAMVLLVRRAQALIEANPNVDFEDLCAQLRMYQASLRTCFTLENFDNLIKNGRMRPLVGTLLHSLGIHVIADATPQGTIHVADKARGEQKTYRAIAALMSSSKDCAGAEVVISHCENLAGALALKEQILASLPVKSVDILSCRGLTSFYAMEKGLIVGY